MKHAHKNEKKMVKYLNSWKNKIMVGISNKSSSEKQF